MTRRVQGFGWIPDLPDHRDRVYGLQEPVQPVTKVPAKGGRAPSTLPPIWDQLQIGSCTAHGALRTFLAEATQQGLKLPMLSRLMEYFNARRLEGTEDQDAGASVRDAIRALKQWGCCLEEHWPYDIGKFDLQPPEKLYLEAQHYLAFEYKRIMVDSPGAPMRSALAAGQVIDFGFPVPDYFEDGSWDPASEAPLPLPGSSTQFIGGHSVAVTYYDFSQRFVSTPSTNRRMRPYFTVDNSWGEGWGMSGRFNMDAEWFTPRRGLAADLWVILAVQATSPA